MSELERPAEQGSDVTLQPTDEASRLVGYDRFLELIARGLDTGRLGGIQLSVTVPGALISGRAVSTKEYLKRAGRQFGGTDGAEADEMEQAFASLIPAKQRSEDERVAYLHIVDAKAFSGGVPLPAVGGGCWRLRLSEVSGFMFGAFLPADR